MTLAIIGGTGLDSLELIRDSKQQVLETPYGAPSGAVRQGTLFGKEVLFLPRHGYAHDIAPHEVNYRANLWALQQLGASRVFAVAAVGGISSAMSPAALVVPDQLIDYTWGRNSTYFDNAAGEVQHVDFSYPYCEELRQQMLAAARTAGISVVDGGTYGATQGPRLETAAEIARMERDGCDLVGMTGMPEAVLARELELCYASCAIVANRAAGKAEGVITMAEVEANMQKGMTDLLALLENL